MSSIRYSLLSLCTLSACTVAAPSDGVREAFGPTDAGTTHHPTHVDGGAPPGDAPEEEVHQGAALEAGTLDEALEPELTAPDTLDHPSCGDSGTDHWGTPNPPGAHDADGGGLAHADAGAPPVDTGDEDAGAQCTRQIRYGDRDGDGAGNPYDVLETCEATCNTIPVAGDCNDENPRWSPGSETDPPNWRTSRCGVGSLVASMDATEAWIPFSSAPGVLDLSTAAGGCLDTDTLSIDYTLPNPTECGDASCSWLVLRHQFDEPLNLSEKDFLVFPFSGTAASPALELQLKLDSDASAEGEGRCLKIYSLPEATALPVMRDVVVPLRWYAEAPGCEVDLKRVTAVEIGIVHSQPQSDPWPEELQGRLEFDSITAVTAAELRYAAERFECQPTDPELQARIASDLLGRQQQSLEELGHGFVPSWFEETPPSYFTYNQALLLIVFSLEYERTADPAYLAAAQAVVGTLLEQQTETGAFYDAYLDGSEAGELTPVFNQWAGNVAWAVIALDSYRRAAPEPPAATSLAIDRAAAWLEARMDEYSGSGAGITDGTEGNISTWFALRAAQRYERAEAQREFILQELWDDREGRLWMGRNFPGLALDVMSGWGQQFLNAVGEEDKALEGLGLALGVFPVPAFDDSMIGLGDIAGSFQPTVEFTAQCIAAGCRYSSFLMDQLKQLEIDGTFPGSPADYVGGLGWNTAMRGIAPASWVYIALHGGLLQRYREQRFSDGFETDTGWGQFEELTNGCADRCIGSEMVSNERALSGEQSLLLWANEAQTSSTNHLLANKKLFDEGQSGTWLYEVNALIDEETGNEGQVGPELSMQNTTRRSDDLFVTRTAGVQYQSNPTLPPSWAIWTLVDDAPGWLWLPQPTPTLQPGEWYSISLEVDFDLDEYVALRLGTWGDGESGAPQEMTSIDLSGIPLPPEVGKFGEEAFWLTLEAENQYNGCSDETWDYRVFYDDVSATRLLTE